MSRDEKYCGHDVEINDDIIAFNRLRKTIFNQVKKSYPTLSELTRANFKQAYADGYTNVLDMAVTILANNNIIDYDSERLDNVIHENFYLEFNDIMMKYQNKINACNHINEHQNHQQQGNYYNKDYSLGTNLAAAAVATAVAGAINLALDGADSVISEKKYDKIFSSYVMEFKQSFENNIGYICEVLSGICAEKFLDKNYVHKLTSKTDNMLQKLDAFIPDGEESEAAEMPENFGELVAEALSVNSASYAVYRKIFIIGGMYMNIEPFEIKKIADIHDIDISNLITDYFTMITRIGENTDLSEKIEIMGSVIDKCSAYTAEQSGRYSDYIANIKSYVLSAKRFFELSSEFHECKNETELFGIVSKLEKITFDNVKIIEDTDELTHSFIEHLEDRRNDYQLELSSKISDAVTSIMVMIDKNKENYTTESAVEISSCLNAVEYKTDSQKEFCSAYKLWIAEKIKEDLKARIKSMSHDDMIMDKTSYYNGTNEFYELVRNDIKKEDYEAVLNNIINDYENKDMFRMCLGLEDITDVDELFKLKEKIISKKYSDSITATYTKKIDVAINDFENKDMFRMCLGLEDITDVDELFKLKEEIISKKYSDSLTATYTKKIDDKLIAINKAGIIKELSAKISSLDYAAVHSEWVRSTSGNSSLYTPDIYLSAEEITAMLAEAVDKYEESYLSDMCSGLETADLENAYKIQAAVSESSYRDSNKSSFMRNIENRIDILRTEEVKRICGGMESMTEEQLLQTASTLVGLNYQNQLKDEKIIKINALIRKCRVNNYASFINSINKSKFVSAEQNKPYLEFENKVIKYIDICVERDNNTFSQNMNGSTLGSLELVLGYMQTEVMLGLVTATYVFMQNRFYAPKYGFIFYKDMVSVSPIKGLLKSEVYVKLNNGTIISVKVPKNECDIVASVFNSFMNLR